MKKIKFLPLLAVGLLALVGCGSSDGQEISQGKAESLYENTVVAEFAVSQIDHRNGIDSAAYVEPTDPYYPVVVNGKLKSGTTIGDVAAAITTTYVYQYLEYFHENQGLDANDVFFGKADIDSEKLATLFQEKVTYTLESGRRVKAHFTGSMKQDIEDKQYGFAMYYEMNYDKNGFVKTAKFDLVVSTDYNESKKEVDTVIKFKGDLTIEMTKL